MISDGLKKIRMKPDEELISFDVVSLYTNVPVSIKVCSDLLFRDGIEKPPIDKETFVQLAKIASCDVIMSTHEGYYQQVDGLAKLAVLQHLISQMDGVVNMMA